MAVPKLGSSDLPQDGIIPLMETPKRGPDCCSSPNSTPRTLRGETSSLNPRTPILKILRPNSKIFRVLVQGSGFGEPTLPKPDYNPLTHGCLSSKSYTRRYILIPYLGPQSPEAVPPLGQLGSLGWSSFILLPTSPST